MWLHANSVFGPISNMIRMLAEHLGMELGIIVSQKMNLPNDDT